MRRLLALVIAVLGFVLLGLVPLGAAPAQAATKSSGMPNLTPYGGYLGNYLAPDGAQVYCIDSPLPWPSGQTSGASTVDTVVTTWGSALPVEHLQKLNYVLLTYGQTADPVQAAAVAAFVNAYTSGWARDVGAGYAAGAWYLNGNATVTAVYDRIWADAEAHAVPAGSAALSIDLTGPTEGTLSVSAAPADATGTVTLAGAVRADTGESSFAVGAEETIPIRGLPSDESREYSISADAQFTAATPAAPTLNLYSTPDQQRTIRGTGPGSITFTATAHSELIPLDFTPAISTAVASPSAPVGEPLVDRLSVALADGSRPWRVRTDGTPVTLVADGVLYGPFAEPPAQSTAVPAGAPIAGRESLALDGPGDYATSGSTVAHEPGYYTWVWTIDAGQQDAAGAASLAADFVLVSPFGLPEETHSVQAAPPRLATTGSAPGGAGIAGTALLGTGVLLFAASRFVRWRPTAVHSGNTSGRRALSPR
ncbi:hypothetical protein BH09ACT5_BH09ACT5_24680 [soil metagenome]